MLLYVVVFIVTGQFKLLSHANCTTATSVSTENGVAGMDTAPATDKPDTETKQSKITQTLMKQLSNHSLATVTRHDRPVKL